MHVIAGIMFHFIGSLLPVVLIAAVNAGNNSQFQIMLPCGLTFVRANY